MPEQRNRFDQDTFDFLVTDESEIALQEARNGLLQFDRVIHLIEQHAPAREFLLDSDLIRDLQRLAVEGIRRSAGMYRTAPVSISFSNHETPSYRRVPKLIEELCAFINRNWATSRGDLGDALHLASYVMWRLNWIHAFSDGNGRTSRALAYLILSVRLGRVLPGTPTIPEQIEQDKAPYYAALDAADAACRNEEVDVSAMENLLRKLLTTQLASIDVTL